MNINGQPWRTIWLEEDGLSVAVIDQTKLPHTLTTSVLNSHDQAAEAISQMIVRGAPLIGVTGAYGLMLAMKHNSSDSSLEQAFAQLNSTRPTAVNLKWALERVRDRLITTPQNQRLDVAREEAKEIAEEDVQMCEAIGDHGLRILAELNQQKASQNPSKPLNILTHCNAGWLATVDWGTALAPIYKAHRSGINVHVWVDETRPRNQGASLTAFELASEGIPHTVIVDNAGGHLMQHGEVDAVIVGSDRTTRRGDVCNKIGTYLKALAAKANDIPFYVALPGSTIDWNIIDGVAEIPIEARSALEVSTITGLNASEGADQCLELIRLTPAGTPCFNPAFDVTPAALVSGLITEKGFIPAEQGAIETMYSK